MRIALVDDHKLFRKGIESMLGDIPEAEVVFQAGNGKELLENLKHHKVDIILLDLEMPEMDGMVVIPIVQKTHPKVKVLVISMHQDDKYVSYAMSLGANGYILKDAEFEELKIALNSIINNGFYFNDKISKALLSHLVSKNQLSPSFNQVEPLNEREKLVLELICKEFTTKEIGNRMHLSPRTIEGYRNQLLVKTGAKNTAGLVVFAAKQGWLEIWINK